MGVVFLYEKIIFFWTDCNRYIHRMIQTFQDAVDDIVIACHAHAKERLPDIMKAAVATAKKYDGGNPAPLVREAFQTIVSSAYSAPTLPEESGESQPPQSLEDMLQETDGESEDEMDETTVGRLAVLLTDGLLEDMVETITSDATRARWRAAARSCVEWIGKHTCFR
jgi:hypothetical protein